MECLATLDNLAQMTAYILEEARQVGIAGEWLAKVELACEEALVNIISYAYSHQPGAVRIYCTLEGGRFVVLLKDEGAPFNPLDAEVNPQLHTPIQERRIGGLGIYLIRKTIAEASYIRKHNKNILRLAFDIPQTPNA